MALPPFNAVVSSASIVFPQRSTAPKYDAWQSETWAMWERVDEFFFGVQWLSHMLSRIRLLIAEVAPGGDEPSPVDEGPAADLLARLAGGTGGQTQLLGDATVHLSVAGEFWLVGETNPVTGVEAWSIRSADELRVSRRKGADWDVREGDADKAWRPLPADSLVVRSWSPHKRWAWRADSPARHALGALTSLDIINKRMLATDLSRLASNGILLYDRARLSVPARSSPAEADVDPFASMLVAIASRGIADPTSPEATIPIPIGYDIDDLTGVDPKALMQVIRMDNGVDAELLAHRDSAVKRLAIAMDLPAEILLGLGDSNHWCVNADTEILTRDGWKSHDTLAVGDLTLTLNHDTGLSEWQPVQAVNTWNVTDEPMVRIIGDRHNSLTTAAHRWPVLIGRPGERRRDWITAGDLAAQIDGARGHAATQRQTYLILSAQHAELPTEAKHTDALVEAVAWYYTEGSAGLRHGRNSAKVIIYQSHTVNPDNCARIEAALRTLFGPPSETLSQGGRFATPESVVRNAEARVLRAQGLTYAAIGERLGVSGTQAHKYVQREPQLRDDIPKWRVRRDEKMTDYILNSAAGDLLTEHAPNRMVRPEFIHALTRAQLELFVHVSVLGDGGYIGGHTPVLSQKDPQMLDAFELAGLLAGWSTYRSTHRGTGLGANGPREKTQHLLILSDRRSTFAPRKRNMSTEAYTGAIWCPTTANGTWLARHAGTVFYTGNSSWLLEESAIKTHVSPLAELICRCLTTGYLLPALTAAGEDLTGPDGGQLLVWYDPSEITARPDRSANVVQAYDRLECSGTALRRELGVDEADAPDAAELAGMALKRAALLPALAASAIEALGGPKLVTDIAGAGGAPTVAIPGDSVQPGARTGPPVPASNGTGP